MSYVTVENPGNAADPATGSLYGSVSYTYNIGECDVTDTQYCTFLNAVDPTGGNTLGLYDSSATDAEYGVTLNSAASNGSKYSVISGYANMPVVDVTFWDTLRFANYLDDGNTETGAYTLLGGAPTPSNASTVTRNLGATVWLPSENEWYKAAYYNPVNATYSTYATQSNTVLGNVISSGPNEANYYTLNGYSVTQSSSYDLSQNYLTAAETFSGSVSYCGTYDQSGDAWNWTDTSTGSSLVLRGGSWWNYSNAMTSSVSINDDSSFENNSVGFRVASEAVPEPSTWAMMTVGVASLLAFRRRRHS